MNIIEALNRLRSDIQTWTANNLKTKVNADDLSTSITTGTLSAGTIIIDGQNIKTFIDNNYVTQINPTGSGNVSFGRKSGSSIGNKSVVIGDNSEASNDNSIAIGTGNIASGQHSTVIGQDSTASGLKSVALGFHNSASGEYAFATGCYTNSNGVAGSTFGNQATTNPNSWCALSSGIHTVANGLVQHVFGMNNVPDAEVSGYSTPAEHLLIVGNGDYLSSDTYESNAMTLDWDGNAWFSGNVYVGSTSGTNKDSGSIKLATENQIPTESTVSGWGFTKNNGTITGIKMNGVNKGTSGIIDLGTVITQHQDISGKVDKIEGKGLSAEDFTTALKTKLEGLNNYNDAKITESISNLQNQLNTLVSGDANEAINSFNEIIAFLDGVKDTEDLESIISSIEQQIAGKMDKITLATVATSGSYKDLIDKPTIPDTNTVSNWGFTKNKGTVTNVSAGRGLIGGDITSTGTIECNLVDFTQNASAASASGSDDNNRLYPVSLDKNGKLSVKVPWVKVSLSGDNAELNEALSNYITKTDIDNYIPTLNGGQKATTGKYVSGVTVSGHTVTVTQENLPEEQYKGTVTSITPGTGLTGASSDAEITDSGTINLKTAATGEIGGIKVGSVSTTSSGANKTINTNKFAVHVDKDGLGYVAIPEYSNGTGSITKVTAGTGLTGGASSGEAILNVNIKDVNKNSKAAVKGNNSDQLYAVELDKDGKLAVSVPWKSTTFEGNTELEGLLEPYALKTDIPSIAGSGFATTSSDQDTNTITVNVSVPNASTSTSGLMSAADKVRLDGIEDNANNYVHPSVNHIPAGGSSGQFLKYKSSGEAQWYTLKSSDIPAHTHSYVTSVTAGEGLNNNGTDTAPSLSVRLAEDNYIGGFKTGFENNKNNRNYGVKIDSSTGKAYVNVPWEAVDFSGNAELSALLGDYAKKGDIPSLSGGSAAGSDTTVVGGVTVNGHTVSVGKKTITGAGTVSVTGTTTGITITGTHPDSLKNPYSLKFGSKTYDGSSEKEITAADLGLGAALKYRGVTTTNVVDDRTTANVTIDSKTHTPSTGDVVFYGNKEFVWNGSKWEELGYANTLTLNKVTTDGPSGTSSVASSGHTHSVTASGSVSSSFTGSAVNTGTPSSNTTSVATGAHTHGTSSNGDHTHTVTATGSVSSSFTGTAVNTGTDSSNVASVSLDSHKHTISATGTSSRTTVPTTSHTHTVAISGSGSFTGTAGNTGGPSANTASVASGTHTHSVTGTVQSGGASHTHTYDTYSLSASASGGVLTISLSTGSGNVGYTTASHTHVFASGSASATATTSRFDVPNTSHTHSFTPSGSVSFSGSNATTGAASTASGHTVSVATGAHVHSMGTAVANDSTSSVSVSTSSHKHSVTASGSVSSSFTGTSATTSKNGSHSHTANASTDNTTNRVSVPNTSHTHSVTAAGSVSSSFTGTAVTSGTPSGTTSVGSSSHTHTVTPTGSIS